MEVVASMNGSVTMSTPLGRLLLLEVEKIDWNSAFERLLQRFEPAGVFFRSLMTVPATWEVASKCTRALGEVPFLAVEDQGAGALCNLFGASAEPEQLANRGDAAIKTLGDLLGKAMRVAGLNMNFAPALDLPADLPASGHLSVIASPLAVTRRAEAFIRGLSLYRVLPCAGHFPGIRIGASEQLQGSPVVGRSMAALWSDDLVPYRTLASQLPFVLVSHAAYKAYDYEFPRPASLSPRVVEGLLRLKLGYRGVALADVSAAARSASVDLAEAALRALEAGCDLLVLPAEAKPLEVVLAGLERAREFGKLPPERIEQALTRVQNARQGLAPPAKEPSERGVSRLVRDFERFAKQYYGQVK